MAPSGHGSVHVSHHTYWLSEPDADLHLRLLPGNGLAVPQAPGVVAILTGIAIGDVELTVDCMSAPPEQVSLTDWEDVVEVSVESPLGELSVTGDAFGIGPGAGLFPVLASRGAGNYRLRVHVKGRDANPDGAPEYGVERYWVISWPDTPSGEAIHKQTDRAGQEWRAQPTKRYDESIDASGEEDARAAAQRQRDRAMLDRLTKRN